MSWNIGHKTFYKPSFLITSSSWPYFLITVGFVNGYDMKMKNHIWLLSLSLKQSTFSFPEFDVDISSKQQPFQVNASFFHSINQKAPTLNELSFSNLSIPTPVLTIVMHQGRPVDKQRLQNFLLPKSGNFFQTKLELVWKTSRQNFEFFSKPNWNWFGNGHRIKCSCSAWLQW